ncbi:MAG: T9SS type A sorting domain-containing protein, partial [Bacteroidota bacterium]
MLSAQIPASAVWPLTANQTANVTGSITAPDQQLSSMQVTYSASVQRSSPTPTAGAWTAEGVENSARYLQFVVRPSGNNSLKVSTVSMNLYVNSGSGMRANVYYSKDSLFVSKTQIGTTFTLTTAAPGTPNVTASPNTDVNTGESFYVRVYPWNIGATTGKYVITNNVTVSGTTLSATAVLASVSTLNQFAQSAGSPSGMQQYTITGTGLTANVIVTPPANFEVSSDSGTTWNGSSSPLSLPVSSGSITGQPVKISVRLNASSAGMASGVITHTSTGATSAEVSVSGVKLAAEPTVLSALSISVVTGSSMNLSFTGGNGSSRLVVVRAADSVSWVPTDGVPVSGADSNFTGAADQGNGNKVLYNGAGSSVTVTGLSSNVKYHISVFEYNSASGNSQNYLTSKAAKGSATTNADPTLSLSKTSLSFGMVLINSTSSELSYTLSGAYLSPASGNVSVTAPSGYEVSLTTGSGFASAVQVPYTAGTLSSKNIFVRLKPTTIAGYNGTIVHSGGAATDVNVTVSGTGVSGSVFSNTPIGYATLNGGTTGGAGGSVTTVTTLAELEAFAKTCENNTNPKILYISGKISASSTTAVTIKHGANISIYGSGNFGELENVGLVIWDYKNVIVRNLKIHEVFYPNDGLSIDECENVWIDHNELYSKIGAGIGVDTYDGLLDIKNGSRYVTVSWNYLHHHMKCSLIGHSDNTGQQATDSQMRITYHHNWFSNTDGRNPSIRYGAIHMFNNFFEDLSDYGIAARDGAHAKIENSKYHNVLLPMSTDKFPVNGLPNGYICETGNLFTGTSGANVISQTGCDFWDAATLPYSYTLDPVESVEGTVKTIAGIGITTGVDLAVELRAFTAALNGTKVELSWSTATEVNNAGFNIERRNGAGAWSTVGFVEGNGTVNVPVSYAFSDNPPVPGVYHYRLKQVDRDGKYSYSNIVEAVTSLTPNEFLLTQNYPNPFNPGTMIQFSIPVRQQATVKVYSAVGQQVAVLFSGIAEAQTIYSMKFDAASFSSGLYFYVLESGSFRET